jgi:hypothetical protein
MSYFLLHLLKTYPHVHVSNLAPLPQGWFRHRFPAIFLYICMDIVHLEIRKSGELIVVLEQLN